MRNRQAGFTLVELLVVVTIIAILISLLAPALEKAIYQAELAKCGANQRAIATTVQTYAVGNRRAYPIPAQGRRLQHQPDDLGQATAPQNDLRVPLIGYLGAKLFQCPLTGQIDMSIEGQGSRPNAYVFSTYDLWFGMRYVDPNSSGQSLRMGDRFSWDDGWEKHTFRLLVSDLNIQDDNTKASISTHPDDQGVMANSVLQDVSTFGIAFVPGVTSTDVTISRWNGGSNPRRGRLDLNFTRDDGSVTRVDGVIIDDPRLERTPAHVDDAVPQYRIHIPAN